jgi:hypothetical protein
MVCAQDGVAYSLRSGSVVWSKKIPKRRTGLKKSTHKTAGQNASTFDFTF